MSEYSFSESNVLDSTVSESYVSESESSVFLESNVSGPVCQFLAPIGAQEMLMSCPSVWFKFV